MKQLNNWDEKKIIKKSDIHHFEFLYDNGFLKEIEDEYFHLTRSPCEVERAFYEEMNSSIANELGLDDVSKEINVFIKKLNKYNEAKDAAESLMGKIAELKSISIKEVHKEMDMTMTHD